jgi:undecaprenyl-diphosphatase
LPNPEFSILDGIQRFFHTAWLDALMPLVTRLGDKGLIWISLALLLLCLPLRRRWEGGEMLCALLCSVLLCNLLLKNWVARPRPFALRPDILLLVPPPQDFSFPSGHSSASFAAAAVLLWRRVPGRFLALGLAVLIAFSRLYLYVHFPTDVLAGAILGFLLGSLAVYWGEKYRGKRGAIGS